MRRFSYMGSLVTFIPSSVLEHLKIKSIKVQLLLELATNGNWVRNNCEGFGPNMKETECAKNQKWDNGHI